MIISLVAYAELKEYLGQDGKLSLEVSPGTRLGEVALALGIPKDRVMNIVCDQTLETWDSFVKDGCVYQILPLICGG